MSITITSMRIHAPVRRIAQFWGIALVRWAQRHPGPPRLDATEAETAHRRHQLRKQLERENREHLLRALAAPRL